MRDEWADPAAGELALAARRAREEVKRRALLSAGAVLVPLPGFDVAVDVGVLVSMMNAVNRAWLGMEERVAVYEALSGVGAVMAGKSVTGVAALTIVKQLGSRWCAGKTARWVPIVGQGAAALSYGLVKWLGEQHVRECLAVRSRVAALLPYEKDSLKKNAQQS